MLASIFLCAEIKKVGLDESYLGDIITNIWLENLKKIIYFL